jgi:hypothetical protein
MLPPKEILDPEAKKPEDWDDAETIADPTDTKVTSTIRRTRINITSKLRICNYPAGGHLLTGLSVSHGVVAYRA